MRDKLHSTLSAIYKNKNSMVSHFYNRGEEIPIWGIFEIMMLGDFADFLLCLNKDARFKDRNANKNVIKWVEKETGISNVMFDYFSDYIALIICLLKHVQYPKRMLAKLLREYEECINELYISLPLPIYNKVVATGIQGKIKKLNAYVKK